MVDQEKREVGGWWMWILALTVVTLIAFTGLRYAGVIGQTVVEREVFEQSYQYTAAQKQRIATYKAQMAELEGKLLNPNMDEADKANINAQLSGIRIQLQSVSGE